MARLLLPRGGAAKTPFLRTKLRRERRAKVVRFKNLAKFNLGFAGHGIGAALEPFDGFFLGLHLPEPEAGHQLLGLAEGPINHCTLAPRETDAHALGTGVESLTGKEDAGFREFLVVFAHLG